MIDLEVIMKKEILQILQKINEAQDPIKIEKLITKNEALIQWFYYWPESMRLPKTQF